MTLVPRQSAAARWLSSTAGTQWSFGHNAGLMHGLYDGEGSPFYTLKDDGAEALNWEWCDPTVGELWWGKLPGDDALRWAALGWTS